jgi:hypothetical protein
MKIKPQNLVIVAAYCAMAGTSSAAHAQVPIINDPFINIPPPDTRPPTPEAVPRTTRARPTAPNAPPSEISGRSGSRGSAGGPQPLTAARMPSVLGRPLGTVDTSSTYACNSGRFCRMTQSTNFEDHLLSVAFTSGGPNSSTSHLIERIEIKFCRHPSRIDTWGCLDQQTTREECYSRDGLMRRYLAILYQHEQFDGQRGVVLGRMVAYVRPIESTFRAFLNSHRPPSRPIEYSSVQFQIMASFSDVGYCTATIVFTL